MPTVGWLPRAPRLVAAVVSMTLIALVMPGSAGAAPRGARWEMNDKAGGMADSSGHKNVGTRHAVTRNGRTYAFNGMSSYVSVPTSPTLNPARANFLVGIRFRLMSLPPNDGDFDLLRKGLAGARGGDFLLEIRTNGKAYCRMGGTSSAIEMRGGPNLADGAWHVIQCAKSHKALALSVDGRPVAREHGVIGSISNTKPLYIGAKPGDDYTHGLLDRIHLVMS